MSGRHRPKGLRPEYAQLAKQLTERRPVVVDAGYWRSLALTLLKVVEQRAPTVAQEVVSLALHWANVLEVRGQLPAAAVVRGFQRALDVVPTRLLRGKKPPPLIGDLALASLYVILGAVIAPIRAHEKAGECEAVARLLVLSTFPLPTPWPQSREAREELIKRLAALDARGRAHALLETACKWTGLNLPTGSRLQESVDLVVGRRAPKEATGLILQNLVGINAKTIANRVMAFRASLDSEVSGEHALRAQIERAEAERAAIEGMLKASTRPAELKELKRDLRQLAREVKQAQARLVALRRGRRTDRNRPTKP